MAQILTDAEFLSAWEKYKSPQKMSNELGLALRNVYQRRRTLEMRYGLILSVNEEKP